MHKITTQNNLLRYAYNETRLLESDQIQRAIDGDPIVGQDFREIVKVINILDDARLEPSKESIERILAHS
jgi:hypothetical protein